jgi:hypothetical protein
MLSLHILAWASALPSDFDRAMREASSSRMVTDTDSYAFCLTFIANERMTEVLNLYDSQRA